MGPSIQQQLQTVPYGEVLLLENTRFHPEEEKNDPEFARQVSTSWEGPALTRCFTVTGALCKYVAFWPYTAQTGQDGVLVPLLN